MCNSINLYNTGVSMRVAYNADWDDRAGMHGYVVVVVVVVFSH